MTSQQIDGVLVQWGERLFYPSNRIVKSLPTPRLDTLMRRKAAVIRKPSTVRTHEALGAKLDQKLDR
jgi:hypothetical protein